MAKRLEIGTDPAGKLFSLPVDLVTQTTAILAKRRAGKSYTMRRIVEQLVKASQQVVLVDPKGDQWGVRSSADGKGPGLPLVILGGERGDVGIEPGGGEVVAKLVVEERVSAVIDLSLFRKNQVAQFMTGFLEALYRLKAREAYRTPMTLVIDEADAVAPQRPMKGAERMLGAAEDLVRRGGQRGIGCVLVSQRSAVLNKNVLTQAQILIALRTIAPQDLDAMKAWVDVHGTEAQRRTLMESLPSLPVGDAWFWSPGWPTVDGIFRRVHVDPIETYDSGATPKPGETRREPKLLADIDMDALTRQMAETVERAKADDPKTLRKRIAELEKEQRSAPQASDTAAINSAVEAERKRMLARAEKETAEFLLNIRKELGVIVTGLEMMRGGESRINQLIASLVPQKLIQEEPAGPAPKYQGDYKPSRAGVSGRTKREQKDPAPGLPPAPSPNGSSPLPQGERTILTAACQYPQGVTREQLTILTGYKRSSRDTYIQRLRGKGLVDVDGGRIIAGHGAEEHLGDFEPLPTGNDLRRYWLDRLPAGERVILEVLIEDWPSTISRDEISNRTDYKRSSRDTYLQRLRSRQIVEVDGSLIKAADFLFDEGL